MNNLDKGALALVVVGALNWGLVALGEFDLVAWIFGGMEFGETNVASRIVYGLVGLAGTYLAARVPAMLRSRSTGRARASGITA